MNQIAKINVEDWRSDLVHVMSPDVDQDKFIAAVTTALTMNPDIANTCTPESIKNACIKAAYDGLRPDGREGSLAPYKEKVERDGREIWEKRAQWMPMVYGIRKKAKEHDGIIIRAEVVHKNDKFHRVTGDEERIEHEPAPLDVDPGPVIGAYAIFTKDGDVIHREVVSKMQIEQIRSASKAPNSPAWTKFYGEMAKKCAVRRGAKTVPMSDRVATVIERVDDFYDFKREIDAAPATPLTQRLAVAKQGAGQGFPMEGFSATLEADFTNSSGVSSAPGDQEPGGVDPSRGPSGSDLLGETAAHDGEGADDVGASRGGPGAFPYSPALYQECADKFLAVASDTDVPAAADRYGNLEIIKNAWKAELRDDQEFVRECLTKASAVLKNGADIEGQRASLYEMRGVKV